MPRFLTVHSLPEGFLSRESLEHLAQVGQRDATVKGIRSFVSISAGKLAAIYQAPDAATLDEFFKRLGFPVLSITQIEYEEVGGSVFQVGNDEDPPKEIR